MKFMVAVPRVLAADEVEADDSGEALEVFRESGAFDEGMTHVQRACNFGELLAAGSTLAYVVNVETQHAVVYEMRLSWGRVPVRAPE